MYNAITFVGSNRGWLHTCIILAVGFFVVFYEFINYFTDALNMVPICIVSIKCLNMDIYGSDEKK